MRPAVAVAPKGEAREGAGAADATEAARERSGDAVCINMLRPESGKGPPRYTIRDTTRNIPHSIRKRPSGGTKEQGARRRPQQQSSPRQALPSGGSPRKPPNSLTLTAANTEKLRAERTGRPAVARESARSMTTTPPERLGWCVRAKRTSRQSLVQLDSH